MTGSAQEFAARGNASFSRLRYGRNAVRGVELTFEGEGFPRREGRWAVSLQADSMSLVGLDFARARLGLDYDQGRGRFDIALGRRPGEDYFVRGALDREVGKGSVQLDELALHFDEFTWALERPAVGLWNDQGLDVQDFVMSGPADSLRIEVDGLIPREGPADLRVSVRDLELERLARLFQRDEIGLTGRLAMNGQLTGTARGAAYGRQLRHEEPGTAVVLASALRGGSGLRRIRLSGSVSALGRTRFVSSRQVVWCRSTSLFKRRTGGYRQIARWT